MAARAQRREYMQLLADCQRVYCEARLLLVAEVVAARMAEYTREALPSLTRSGCSYLMQVCPRSSASVMWDTSKHVQRLIPPGGIHPSLPTLTDDGVSLHC